MSSMFPHDDTRLSGFYRGKASESPPGEAPASGEVVDVIQLWNTICQHYRVVLAVAVLVFSAVMLATLTSRMEFRSSGRLYLGELDGNPRLAGAADAFDIGGASQGDVGSEVEIIRSRSLITEAIRGAGLNVSITPYQSKPPRYYRWLLSRRDPTLIDVGVRQLRAVNSVLSPGVREEQAYIVRFLADGEYEVSAAERGPLGRGRLGTPLSTREFDLTLLPGTEGAPKPGAKYDVVLKPMDDVMDRALDVLEVSAPRSRAGADPVKVITLEFIEGSPLLAASFLEQLMHAYLKERQSWKTEDATAAEAFVTAQLKGMKESLDQVQQKLADYRSNNRVVVLDNEAKAMIEQIAKYEEQRLAARLQVAALGDIKRSLKNGNAPMGAYLLGEANDSVLEGMSASLSEARRTLTDLETRFSDAAPDVKEQRAQVASQLDAVNNYVTSRLSRAQESLGTLNTIIGQFENKLKTVPGAELGLAQLSRESEVYSRTYSYLLERQQQAAIVRASTLSKNRVLDAPRVPTREYSPKLALRVASGVLGLVLGVALVLMRSFFAGTFQSEADVRRSIGGVGVLGIVPQRKRPKELERYTEAEDVFGLPAGDPDCRFVESFRTLRTNLYRATLKTNQLGTVVLITSPSPGDGKTTSVRWLAAMLAADGQRVLVVDADVRKFGWDDVPSNPQEQGLQGVLTTRCHWIDAVRRTSASVGGFHTLDSGGAVRPELLSGQVMLQFLEEARNNFDFVLIDSPSFPFVSDALVLSVSADWVVSVLRIQNTPRKLAQEHVRRLSISSSSYAVLINGGVPNSSANSGYPTAPPGYRKRSLRPRAKRSGWWLAAALVLGSSGAFLFFYAERARASTSELPTTGEAR